MSDILFDQMPVPPQITPEPATEQSLTNKSDTEVYFAPLPADAETRGITDNLKLSLADFTDRVVQCMEKFNEKYSWEIEVNGEIKVYGVFSGSAKLKIGPREK